MVTTLGELSGPSVVGLEVSRADDAGSLGDAQRMAEEGFGTPSGFLAGIYEGAPLRYPDLVAYLGRIGAETVTTALGLRNGSTVGIFNVGTPPVYRRKGYGGAVTARAVADAFAGGASFAYLQASIMGEPVYRGVGFREVDAIAVLRAATAGDPDSSDLHNNLGAALMRAGDLNGAEDSLREAVRLRPEAPAMRVNLATLLARRGDFPEASNEFEQAIRIDNSFADAHSAYGTALAAHGDWARARDRLWNTHNNLGIALQQLGDAEGATREFRAAIGVRHEFPAAHYNLGAALAARGSVEEAERHFKDAIRIAPDYYEAHLKLGQLLCAGNRCGEGEPHLRKAAQSPDPKVRQAALDGVNK